MGSLMLAFHFSSARRGCGNVGIAERFPRTRHFHSLCVRPEHRLDPEDVEKTARSKNARHVLRDGAGNQSETLISIDGHFRHGAALLLPVNEVMRREYFLDFSP